MLALPTGQAESVVLTVDEEDRVSVESVVGIDDEDDVVVKTASRSILDRPISDWART